MMYNLRDLQAILLAKSEAETMDAINLASARATLLYRLRRGGLHEAPEFRPRVFGYRVSGRAMERRVQHGLILPRWTGWTWRRAVDSGGRHDSWFVGPWWLVLPGKWRVDLYCRFCEWALRVGLAREPHEGCYYHELIWFPDAPRFK